MTKLMKELQKNKYTTIVFCIFLGLFLLAWLFYGILMPSSGKPNYGSRLDDIPCEKRNTEENLQIDCKYNNELANQSEKIVSDLEAEEIVVSAKVDVKGKVVNTIVIVKEGTQVKAAKKLTKQILGVLTKEQLKHYDIQLFIKNESKDAKGYPTIGYMSAGEKKFTY